MRIAFAVLGLCLSIVQASRAADAPLPDVRRVLPAWAETWRAADIDKMMAFYEDSRTLVAIESRGVMHKGSAAVRMMYQNAFAELVWEKVGVEEVEVTPGRQRGLGHVPVEGRGDRQEAADAVIVRCPGDNGPQMGRPRVADRPGAPFADRGGAAGQSKNAMRNEGRSSKTEGTTDHADGHGWEGNLINADYH